MATDAVDERSPRPLLTLGPVERIRVQVGYRARPDGPADQHFLLDVTLPEPERSAPQEALDESRVLAALEPVLYAGSDAPRHYSVHVHRWHTSWGPSPGAFEVGILVTAGSRASAVSDAWTDGVTRAFRDLLAMVGPPQATPTSRDAAILRARRSAATAYAADADALTLSAEEHHPGRNAWTVGLRTTAGDEYDVLVGLVDGFAGSVRVRHGTRSEVSDSVGSE